MKVLQPDEAQEARTYYARICDWVELLLAELDGRDFPVVVAEAIVVEYVRSRFTPQYPPEFFKAQVRAADAMERMAPNEDEE